MRRLREASQRLRRYRRSRMGLVLASCLLLTVVATWLSVRVVKERSDATVESAIEQDLSRLNSRMSAYLALLRATRSFVKAEGESLDEAGFGTFVAGLRISSDYPGIQGIGWTPRIGRSDHEFSILYLEPLDERNRAALGFNMHSEAVRAEAMDRARDRGEAAMSGSVLLKQEILPEKSAGFLIYEPIYRGGGVPATAEQRRQELLGFVYAPFRADDFFSGVFEEEAIRVRAIHAASAETEPRDDGGTLLYGHEDPERAGADDAQIVREAEFGGQRWTLHFDRAITTSWPERLLPALVLLVGLLVTGLLATLTRAQSRAHRRAEERTAEVRQQLQFAELLVGIVSHDLRNPLNVILLNATLLERAPLSDEFARCVQRIHSSGDLSLRMIRDLLDFTQARLAGGIPVVRTPGDFLQIVQQAVDEVKVAHPDRAITVWASGDGSGTWDADRIAQVVSNLVNNALVYGRADAPIRVSIVGTGQPVQLTVHNEGEPIRPELQAELFQPLRQGDSGKGSRGRNIGLGLYIVQQIVQAHGGSVACHSTREEGTRFVVELPRTA